MKIDIHRVVAVFAVMTLVGAVLWWISGRKRDTYILTEKKLMDSINLHVQQAENHADIARKYLEEAEKYAKVYNDTLIDSTERTRLGAEIWANAVRKADSIRKRSP